METEKRRAVREGLDAFLRDAMPALIGVFAHEVVDYLRGMEATAELLVDALGVEGTDILRARKLAALLLQSMPRAIQAASAFLVIYRSPDQDCCALDPCEVLRDTVRLCRRQCHDAGVEISLRPCKEQVVIIGNHYWLALAFSSLIRNGIESYCVRRMGPGKTENTETIGVESRVVSGNYVVTVSDSGVGIPRELLPKVFDPGFTTKITQQGFGLHICRKVVEAHAGKVEIESTENRGTLAKVLLPVSGSTHSAASPRNVSE
jgi:signal transduction histidine kinase